MHAIPADRLIFTRADRIERRLIGTQDVRLNHVAGFAIDAGQNRDTDNGRTVDLRGAIEKHKTGYRLLLSGSIARNVCTTMAHPKTLRCRARRMRHATYRSKSNGVPSGNSITASIGKNLLHSRSSNSAYAKRSV